MKKIVIILSLVLSHLGFSQIITDTGTNVGISNATPAYKLDVNGTGRFSSNLLIGDPLGARTEINTSTNHKIYAPTNKKTIDLDGNFHGGGFVGVYRADNQFRGVFMESQPDNNHNALAIREMRNDEGVNDAIRLSSQIYAGDTTPTNYMSMPYQNSTIVIGGFGNYKKGLGYGLINKLKTSFENDVYVETGNVGIGTTDTKGFKLGVQGKIAAEEIKVAVHASWADFVFENNYNLPTLKEVEQHIKEKGHLKDIPSAKEVAKNGVFLGEMDAKLLQKIEELTLYTISQEKRMNKLEKENEALKTINSKLQELQERLENLESKK